MDLFRANQLLKLYCTFQEHAKKITKLFVFPCYGYQWKLNAEMEEKYEKWEQL